LEELNKAYLERIKKYNSSLNAYLFVNEQNKQSFSTSKKIPAAIKDVISTKDIPTTAGSKVLGGYRPPYDATVVNLLLEQGVGVIGKTNCDEFAMGASGENSAYGVTKNPWDKTKVPGGTSSGSAVAVATDLCVFALGSDTGGSIRQPASLCGVVGLKTSYGRVSRYGLIATASSLDTIGSLTKSVEDAALVLSWISGPDGWRRNHCPQPGHLDGRRLGRGKRGRTARHRPRLTWFCRAGVGSHDPPPGLSFPPKCRLICLVQNNNTTTLNGGQASRDIDPGYRKLQR